MFSLSARYEYNHIEITSPGLQTIDINKTLKVGLGDIGQ